MASRHRFVFAEFTDHDLALGSFRIPWTCALPERRVAVPAAAWNDTLGLAG